MGIAPTPIAFTDSICVFAPRRLHCYINAILLIAQFKNLQRVAFLSILLISTYFHSLQPKGTLYKDDKYSQKLLKHKAP